MSERKLTVEPGHYPGFIEIKGLPFSVSIVTSATGMSMDESIAIDDAARRLVACWNACEGLSTEDLEKTGLVSAVGKQLIEADQQRDELLATLKRVRLFVIGESLPTRSQALDDIDAAIAKIEGGAA